MITLPFHTFHVLQPLNVSCFNHSKLHQKKKKHEDMVKNDYVKLDKITVIEWLGKALDQTLFKITSN
jgi:hypothetical protein